MPPVPPVLQPLRVPNLASAPEKAAPISSMLLGSPPAAESGDASLMAAEIGAGGGGAGPTGGGPMLRNGSADGGTGGSKEGGANEAGTVEADAACLIGGGGFKSGLEFPIPVDSLDLSFPVV